MERYAGLPPLPARIERLPELALDLWWSWHDEARAVFRNLDYPLWRATAHNPVRMLWMIPRATLDRIAQDPAWLQLYDRALAGLDDARAARFTWCTEQVPDLKGQSIAYFSAEFALHQSLPIYAGGLGVLAGDHCKEASDLGVPLIGIGFMYPQGYFHQHITADGWQEEGYEKLNWADTPIEAAATPAREPAVTAVPLGDRTVLVAVWRVRLGRVTLYLLDTDLEENAPWDRSLSARLYGGDRETRVQQEIILGIGGVRVLRSLGCHPTVWHLNEGHAGFVVLQRIREFVDQGLSFDAALEEVRRTTVFTTHTPVPAGHDAFNFQLVEKHLAGAWGSLGTYRPQFLALGEYDNGNGPQFNMTALALRAAGSVNAVSQLHGEVTREMWVPIWPGTRVEDAPVKALTNGVHVPTWVSHDMSEIFARYLGEDWIERHDAPGLWDAIHEIPDAELWAVRSALRNYLFSFIRQRARALWTNERVSAARVLAAGTLLDSDALDDRFRATIHRLQAARPDLPGFRASRADSQHPWTSRSNRVCRQIAPGRRHGQTPAPGRLSPRAGPGLCGPRRVRRGLRPARRALPRPGLRRMAEQPPQAARGQRHERDEGVDQRRAALQHRRWLVGRGIQRCQWLAHRWRRQRR